ncbi:hypothetical protein [Catenulispora pinisilvae]|uniref:hypothetical protein n=1 Tax=Catenulispora pinisilvae TaxID=2705253 RepID=UPI0034DD1BBF
MTNTNEQPGDAVCQVYSCRLPLSTRCVNYVADLLRKHLKAIGSRWRSRTAGQIAVLVLAVPRHDQRAADLAGGNQVSAATIRRWTDEVIALLAAKAPRLDRALKRITRAGGEAVLLDGTLIRTRRRSGKANRKNYSLKHRSHGLLFLALTDEAGNLIWMVRSPSFLARCLGRHRCLNGHRIDLRGLVQMRLDMCGFGLQAELLEHVEGLFEVRAAVPDSSEVLVALSDAGVGGGFDGGHGGLAGQVQDVVVELQGA